MAARCLTFLAIAAALSLPAAAQDQTNAPTPEDDLDCALFTAIVLDESEDQLSGQEQTGIVAGMTYFIGRWEVARGGDLEEAMKARVRALTPDRMQELGPICGGRMETLGGKMMVAGRALIEMGEAEPQAAPESGARNP